MTANKLFKLLQRDKNSFNRLEQYRKILEQSSRVLVDFSKFKSFDILASKAADAIKVTGLSLPFDNVLLDIKGVEIPGILDGKIEKRDLTLHVIPVKISTDISTFSVVLVQDMRLINNDIFPRSYLIALDAKDILIAPVVDDGMQALGCNCDSKNLFSNGKVFKQLQSFTPGFKADKGFALWNCSSNLPACKQLLKDSQYIMQITLATMAYITVPCHRLIEVSESTKPNGLKNMPHYILCDENRWAQAQKTKKPGILMFNDGNDFDKYYQSKPFEITDEMV